MPFQPSTVVICKPNLLVWLTIVGWIVAPRCFLEVAPYVSGVAGKVTLVDEVITGLAAFPT